MSEPASRVPIRTLSGVLANQIAAGEVVERPASVVKELVENALDADAKTIAIELETGGTHLIRVRDDGVGIPSGELVLALSRHATSKIAALDDLDRIASMGFRGEALPSIASVSRLVLQSRPRDTAVAARVRVDGGVVGTVEPAASKVGTTVEVRDLFFNVPARRKFLRTPRTELRHVEDALRRLALARPDVSFSLHHDTRKALDVNHRMEPPRRLARLLGEEFAASAFEISFDAGDLSMHGFLAPPGAARSRPDRQFLFVNGRSVRDDVVRHAVRVGFGDTLAGAGYPAFVLHLGIDPAAVDVNVHPTKHEVRFREPRHVHNFVRHAIARALVGIASETSPEAGSSPPGAGSLALEAGVSSPGAEASGPEAAAPEAGTAGPGLGIAVPETGTAPGAGPSVPGANSAEPGAGASMACPEASHPGAYPIGRPSGGVRPGAGQVRDQLAAYAALSAAPRPAGPGTAPGRIRLGNYVLVEGRGALLLIDLGAGRRALVRDRLDAFIRAPAESSRTAAPVSRPLLIPHTQTTPEAVADAVDEANASLRSLGVEIRRGAPGSITLRAVPACLAGIAPGDLLDTVAAWAKTRGSVPDLADAFASLAKAALSGGDVGDIVDAALEGRMGIGVATVDETALRRLFVTSSRC